MIIRYVDSRREKTEDIALARFLKRKRKKRNFKHTPQRKANLEHCTGAGVYTVRYERCIAKYEIGGGMVLRSEGEDDLDGRQRKGSCDIERRLRMRKKLDKQPWGIISYQDILCELILVAKLIARPPSTCSK